VKPTASLRFSAKEGHSKETMDVVVLVSQTSQFSIVADGKKENRESEEAIKER
jgi:hypothetical protein